MLSPKHMLKCLCVILSTLLSLHSCGKISRQEQLVALGNYSVGSSCPLPNDFAKASLLSAYLDMNLGYFEKRRRPLTESCAYSIIGKSLAAPASTVYLNAVIEFGLKYPSRFPEIFDRISTSLTYDVYSNLTDATLKLYSFFTFPQSFCSCLTLNDLFELDSAFAASADGQASIAGSMTLFESRKSNPCPNPLMIGNDVQVPLHRPHPFITHAMFSSDFLKAYEPYYPPLMELAFNSLDSPELKKKAFLEPRKIVPEVYDHLKFEDLCSIFANMKLEDMDSIRRLSNLHRVRIYSTANASEFNKCIPEELLYDIEATDAIETFKKKMMVFPNGADEELFLTQLQRNKSILFDFNVSTAILSNRVGSIDDVAIVRFLSSQQPARALALLPLMNMANLSQAEFAASFFNMTANDCDALNLSLFKGHESLAAPFLTRNLRAFEDISRQSSCSYILVKNSLTFSNEWMDYDTVLTAIMDEKTEHVVIKTVFECMSSRVREEITASNYAIMKRRLFLDALAIPTQNEFYGQLDMSTLQNILLASFTSSEAGILGLVHFADQLESAGIKIGAQVYNLTERPTSVSLVKAAKRLGGSVDKYLLKNALLVMLNVSASISAEEYQLQSPRHKKDIFLLGKHYQADLYGHIRPIDLQEIMSVERISASDLEDLEELLQDLLPRHIVFGSALKYGDHFSVDGLFSYSDCANPTSDECVKSKEFLRRVSTNIPDMRASILGR